MYTNLNKKLGVDLSLPENLKLLNTKYTYEKYVENVFDKKIKTLETLELNNFHFITGMATELIEMSSPFLQLYSLAKYGDIVSKDINIFDDGILWNLVEEMGDFQFFRAGLVKTNELVVPKINISNDVRFEDVFNEINSILVKADLKNISHFTYTFGENIGLILINEAISEQLVSLMKKNIISENETTFKSLKPKLTALVYALDLSFEFMRIITNQMVIRICDLVVNKETNEYDLSNLISMDSIYNLNDIKLNKRYKGKLTNNESDKRDYNNEKGLV